MTRKQTWTIFTRYNEHQYRYEWGIIEKHTHEDRVLAWFAKEAYEPSETLHRWITQATMRCMEEVARLNRHTIQPNYYDTDGQPISATEYHNHYKNLPTQHTTQTTAKTQ